MLTLEQQSRWFPLHNSTTWAMPKTGSLVCPEALWTFASQWVDLNRFCWGSSKPENRSRGWSLVQARAYLFFQIAPLLHIHSFIQFSLALNNSSSDWALSQQYIHLLALCVCSLYSPCFSTSLVFRSNLFLCHSFIHSFQPDQVCSSVNSFMPILLLSPLPSSVGCLLFCAKRQAFMNDHLCAKRQAFMNDHSLIDLTSYRVGTFEVGVSLIHSMFILQQS